MFFPKKLIGNFYILATAFKGKLATFIQTTEAVFLVMCNPSKNEL
jgi:hypothetical protein